MWSRLNCSLQMSSKPPLCAGVGLLCTAELGADYRIVAKVVFTWHRTSSWIKLTASERTVNIQEIMISSLPKTCGEMDANVSTNVDVFHFLAVTPSSVIYYVEVLEVSTNVIFEIDAVCWVTACGSPVSGVTLQGLHSCQAQAVQIPALGVLVHWSVVLEASLMESVKVSIDSTPRHHQGPSRSGF